MSIFREGFLNEGFLDIDFFIQESENFNFITTEEIVTEKFSLSNIKDTFINMINRILEAIKKLKNMIKKAFNRAFIKKCKDVADKSENDIKEFVNNVEKSNNKSSDDKAKNIRKMISEINKKFLKEAYNNFYVLADSQKFFNNEACNELSKKLQSFENFFEEQLKRNKYDFVEYKDIDNWKDENGIFIRELIFISQNVSDQIHWGSDKNGERYIETFNISDLMTQSINVIKNLLSDESKWERAHYAKGGYPNFQNFPKMYKDYCGYIEKQSYEYYKYLDALTRSMEQIRAVILKSFNYDIKNYDQRKFDQDKDYQFYRRTNDTTRLVRYFGNINKTIQFNINYINHLIQIDMKGIKAGAILLGKSEGWLIHLELVLRYTNNK